MQKGFTPIIILLGLVIAVIVAGGAFYLGRQSSFPLGGTATPSPATDETANWKTFTSKTEGFALRYPPDWTIEDTSSGNCGHAKLDGTDCRERFYFVATDGLRVGFVIHKDRNNDRISCGVQSDCNVQYIKNLEVLNIPNLGQVYLVSYVDDQGSGGQFNNIALHKPVDSGTIPVLGENKHSDYWIDFSLPSKTGGRFVLNAFTNTAENQNSKWTEMPYEQFYNSDSVQKAIKILKSLSY